MSDIWIVFSIIAAIIVLFALDIVPVIAVCMGAALALWASGILTLQQSLAGFGDPAVIFIASLFVVSAGLGVTAWAGQILIRQAVPMGPGAYTVLAAMGIMVILLATGIVPPAVASLVAAGIILISGVLKTEQVYRSIKWTTVILVAALTPLSTAMQVTGAAAMLADGLVDLVGDAGPRAVLAGLFLLSAFIGQVISNTATSLIVIPIAIVAANQMGISVQPVMMSVSVACAGAFLTPVATPTNLMVMEPGAYKFGDYWKLGLPMLIWFFLVAVFYIPLIWSF